MKRLVIDTHILLWYLTNEKGLSQATFKILDELEQTETSLIIPTLVLVELLRLLEKKDKAKLFDFYLAQLERMPTVTFLPLVVEVVQELKKVPATLNLHDRLLVASARFSAATLMTQDSEIIRSRAVETVS